MRQAVCLGLLCLLTELAAAADYRVDAQNYHDYLRRLQPGDRVLLESGDYPRGLPLSDLSGHASQPIVIGAANPAAPPRFIARPGANTVSLSWHSVKQFFTASPPSLRQFCSWAGAA